MVFILATSLQGVPFQSAILGGITEGKSVTIQGQANGHAKR